MEKAHDHAPCVDVRKAVSTGHIDSASDRAEPEDAARPADKVEHRRLEGLVPFAARPALAALARSNSSPLPSGNKLERLGFT
jgi:hypothetical protein